MKNNRSRFCKRGIFPLLVIAILPIFALFWLPKNEVLGHGSSYPWPGVSQLRQIVSYHLSSWLIGPNYDFVSSIFYSYAGILSFIGGSAHNGQLLFLYLGFVGCTASMYMLGRSLGLSRNISIFSGIFYCLSPAVYSGFPIEIVNIRVLPFYVCTPLLLAVTIRCLNSNRSGRYLALLGLISTALGTPGYSSLQYFVLHSFLIFGYCIFYLIGSWGDKVKMYKGALISCVIFFVIFLSNFYWLFPFLANINTNYLVRSEPGYSDSDLANGLSVGLTDGLRMLPYPPQRSISPWINYYYNPLLVSFIFLLLCIGFFFGTRRRRDVVVFLLSMVLLLLFVEKGTLKPYEEIGDLMLLSFAYVTRLLRNPGYLNSIVVVLIPLIVGFGLKEIAGLPLYRTKQVSYVGVAFCVVFITIYGYPYITGSLIKTQLKDGSPVQTISVPNYFATVAEQIKNGRLVSNNIEVPTFFAQSSYVRLNWSKKTYLGTSPLNVWSGKFSTNSSLSMGSKSFFNGLSAPQVGTISISTWSRALSLLNVKNLVYYGDTDWNNHQSNRKADISKDDIEKFLSSVFSASDLKTYDQINLISIPVDMFLPRFYSAQTLQVYSEAKSSLDKILPEPKFLLRTALVSKEQNVDKKNILEKLNSEGIENCILEFKRVDHTKYRINIHASHTQFPLVFSESFDSGWKAYLASGDKNSSETIVLKVAWKNLYKIFDGNQGDQASAEELPTYIKNGWITTLGNGKEKQTKHYKWENGKEKLDYVEKYNIDFVSKNFQGTIQNDNLPNGPFWETWLPNKVVQIPEENHLMVNGYANSWIIDTEKLCANSGYCTKNPDGTYDMELIIEFWPQRLFYIGAGISVTTLLVCVGYLIVDGIKQRNKVKL